MNNLVSLTSEATLWRPNFSKGLTKLTILPDYKRPGLLLPSFATSSKIGPDFSNKKVLKFKLPKNNFNKKYAPKLLFFNEIKIRKIRMIFDIENSL